MSEKQYEPTSELPPGPREPRRGSSGLLFAIALIVVGVAILMGNMGIAAINWEAALSYWPILLILLGLDILIGRQSALGAAVMALVTLGALIGVLWLSGREAAPRSPEIFARGQQASGQIDVPLDGAKSLRVEVDLSVMELTLGSQPGTDLAAQGSWTTDEALKPEIEYELDDDTGVLTIRQPGERFGFPTNLGIDSEMTLNLPRGIPIELVVNDDLGATSINLTSLIITSLDVQAGSGTLNVTLPEVGQMGDVKIHGDLGSVMVTTPGKATLNMDSLDVTSGSGSLTVLLPGTGTIGDLNIEGDLGEVTVGLPQDATLQIGPAHISSGSGALTVALPSQGKAEDVTIEDDLGSLTVYIPGTKNTLRVDKLDVRGGSGSLTVTLPALGNYEANIQADLGSVTVILPAGLEAHVNIDSGIVEPDVTSARLEPQGKNTWETSGYDDGDNRVLVDIEAGSGGVHVKDE